VWGGGEGSLIEGLERRMLFVCLFVYLCVFFFNASRGRHDA
jgi:hypothetical protein